jgi:hypothetical protein
MSSFIKKALLGLMLTLAMAAGALAQAPEKAPAKLQAFPTAEAAANALTDAIRKDDDNAVQAMLGGGWQDFVPGTVYDEDAVRDKFLKAWDEHHELLPQGDDKALTQVGTTGWVSPIPIVKDGNEWRFDIEAGKKEVEARTIGHNELAVIQTLLSIVDAQREYASLDPMKTGAPVYARRLVSSSGHKDGLYWEAKPGEPESPLGPLLAKAQLGDVQANGYYGYRFRLLYSQGADAPGGAHDYLVNGRMVGGFAVIAWPVEYDKTGVMTFMVNQRGDVYEDDLGPDTAQEAAAITVFNPGEGWEKSDMTP